MKKQSFKVYIATKDWKYKQETYSLTDVDAELYSSAVRDFETSQAYVNNKFLYIWKYAMKAYHMSTEDRKRYIKDWQSNVSFGLVRWLIDVFISTLTERPIAFSVQGITPKGMENASKIRYALASNADATNLHVEVKHAMKEALITGTFAFAIWMLPDADEITYVDYSDDNGEPTATEAKYTNMAGGCPYAKAIDVWKIFPDPYNNQLLRHVTERDVTDLSGFIERFGSFIASENNKSPMKHVIEYLSLKKNRNGADLRDYGRIKEQIWQQINHRLSIEDAFNDGMNINTTKWANVFAAESDNEDVISGLIEYHLYATKTHMVLRANWYPVYIGKNPYGFIPYELCSTTDVKENIGCEGTAYLAEWMNKIMDSFGNNYLDSVKAVASPTLVARKWLFVDEESIENAAPWSVIWSESEVGDAAIRPLDRGSVQDYGIMWLVESRSSKLTGISEYNQGGSTKERTATGALAVTQSSQKRLAPFLDSLVKCMSGIAQKWLLLMIEYWVEARWVAVTGDEAGMKLKNKDLIGGVNVTLQMDSMFSAIKDFEYKKLLEVFTQTRGTGVTRDPEIIREIFKSQWLDPDRFIMPDAPDVIPQEVLGWATPPWMPEEVTPEMSPEQIVWQDIQQAVTPQVNLGNEWQWQP